jgi:hypothetical protein
MAIKVKNVDSKSVLSKLFIEFDASAGSTTISFNTLVPFECRLVGIQVGSTAAVQPSVWDVLANGSATVIASALSMPSAAAKAVAQVACSYPCLISAGSLVHFSVSSTAAINNGKAVAIFQLSKGNK